MGEDTGADCLLKVWFLQWKIKFFWWVLVRALAALLKEGIVFLLKKQQTPEQAPATKVQYGAVKTTCLA